MPEWDVEPDQLAAMVVEQFPYEAEQIVLDFLEDAATSRNPRKALFWTMVLNTVEHMQIQLSGETTAELRFDAVM